ncbi:MAG: Protein translocase subunit SecA [Chloroflexi bacterium]|nr:Protein translocase subunit SecA [Chloroflexota bacterium]
MLTKIIRVLGGNPHKRKLEEFSETVDRINNLEPKYEEFSLEELHAQTAHFRLRLARGESLDEILPEAFAVVREASKRTLGLRHYDVQLIGGIAMHQGLVAEMLTGEGKTLAATMPLYLNALTLNPRWIVRAEKRWGEDPTAWAFDPVNGIPVGRGVHLVTVNDYLARRDARWMAPIYDTLGLGVGVLQMAARTEHGKKAFLVDLEKKSPHEDRDQLDMVLRKRVYATDIVYGTNSEFGFDHLRDSRAMSLKSQVQRGHYYAIIDEVDNVLIDEARTPLIISGPSHDDPEWYRRMARVVKQLKPADYEINIRDKNITLTPLGETRVEEILGRPLRNPDRPEDITPEQARLLGYLEQALRAEYIYKRNKDYIVQTGKVVIVDEFTGRLMPGRRWSNGLHQAVEAKEGVKVQSESVTYATITIQNYFRMYEKLSGMTGTAVTEAEEFNEIYQLDPIAIPSNLDYVANWTDEPLISLQVKEEDTGFEYTYYVDENDPDGEAIFWKRKDYSDLIYMIEEAKLRAIAEEILSLHVLGRPVLVGTTSVELSERVSKRLNGASIRMLAYTLLIRNEWMRANNRIPDGRKIPQLQPLTASLDELRTTDLRRLAKELDLDLALNIKSPQNISRLLRIFDLDEEHRERLEETLRRGVKHDVLNARKHTAESQIIAGAGAFGAVTIATNMAGRGVDIKLGGELAEEVLASVSRILRRAGYDDPYDMTFDERRQALEAMETEDYGIYETEIKYFLKHMEDKERVKALGGLHVIGSERHEARRIDNQLRGRAARQGDPGSSRFYLSMEDELMQRFGGQQMEALLNRLQVDEFMPIENRLVDRIVESSQSRVEGANFDIRKHLLEYDDVLNLQREKIYAQRERIFTKSDLSEDVTEMLEIEVQERVSQAILENEETWRLLGWLSQMQPTLNLYNEIFPSYSIQLVLEYLHEEHSVVTKEQAPEVLLELAGDVLHAEKEHMLEVTENLFEQSQSRYQQQLEERLELLDMFAEGLGMEEEGERRRSSSQISDELNNLLRTRINLSPEQWKGLAEGSFEVKEEIQRRLEQHLKRVEIRRLVGGTERVLKTSLDLKVKDFEEHAWDEIFETIFKAVNALYDQRENRYLSDPREGRIAKSVHSALDDHPGGEVTQRDLIALLGTMREGRRATFSKKSHRRVWVRMNRLNYIYFAGKLLGPKMEEGLEKVILAHLTNAQDAMQRAWGRSESLRLAKVRLSELEEDIQDKIQDAIGEADFHEFADEALGEIPAELQEQIEIELGRAALSQIYRELLLRVISELWVDYLTEMEALRVKIGLEAYGQRDPLTQYKTQAFQMFSNLMHDMRMSVVTRMFTFRPRDLDNVQASVQRGSTERRGG